MTAPAFAEKNREVEGAAGTAAAAPIDEPSGPGTLDLTAEGALFDVLEEAWRTKPEELLTPEESFETFLTWCEAQGREPWDHQLDALLALAAGDHVILGTPTGSGKSLVALGLAAQVLGSNGRFYYTAPIKALVNEKFFDFARVLGRDVVGMVTGDVSINPEAPVVCCTAEILAQIALAEGPNSATMAVAMDEFHYWGDADRGWAWQVPLLTLTNTQFLLMSATLGDMSAVAAALEERTGRTVTSILDAPRPVPLTFDYKVQPIETVCAGALDQGEGPLYLVHFSQDAALATATSLASYGVTQKSDREAIKHALKNTRFTTPFGKTLARLLAQGVGVHHAGMLPRYRLVVEKLAQEGLLPVICGTDTLGVGINVPIHTVVLTQLTKFDGVRMRRLHVREFHQIAGRAGRAGFDTEGCVIALAPEYEIENEKARAKAAGDPKKQKKLKLKRAPQDFVGWNEATFKKLCESAPETLHPHMKITHAMVLALVARSEDAWELLQELVEASMVSDAQKEALLGRGKEILTTLIDAGIVETHERQDGSLSFTLTMELPPDFALDWPLSPFMLAALELLDKESDTYALDVVSMIEATLEDPRAILNVFTRRARDAAWQALAAEGVDFEERKERVAEVTYEKPLEELLDAAYERYCQEVPWARDYTLSPKPILRTMIEGASSFKSFISEYKLSRCEGLLLRYLSDAWRVLDKTIPAAAFDERLSDIKAWLGFMVRSIDSSLIDEWQGLETEEVDVAAPSVGVVADVHGLRVQVKNALARRLRALARRDAEALGEMDGEWGFGVRAWSAAVEAYFSEHELVQLDTTALSWSYIAIDDAAEQTAHTWAVTQRVRDEDNACDFLIKATVDLDASQENGEVVFTQLKAGFFEDFDASEGA